MLGAIYIGMSGLQGYSQGLRVIANNTANINTPGYKGSTLQFADMFYSNQGSGSGTMQVGYGLNTAGTVLNFEQGELRQTGNDLDLAIDGQGLFTVQDSNGNLHYTRAGQFTFNAEGVLVSRVDQSKVMGQDANGTMGEISIANASMSAGKATTTVKFGGLLNQTGGNVTIEHVNIIDALGGQHEVKLILTDMNSAATPNQWKVQIDDGTAASPISASNDLIFSGGNPTAASAKPTFTFTPGVGGAMTVTLDFSTGVTSFASSSTTLNDVSQDGYLPGALTGVAFDAMGTLVMSYANGQTIKGSRLSLGRFDSVDAVESVGSNQFDATNSLAWHTGLAGEGAFGSVRSGMVELSNVDLSQEFSDLVIMQRGYQASSQVISTANDMLQELFQMKNK
jgi:flagellar hook protein FlgE